MDSNEIISKIQYVLNNHPEAKVFLETARQTAIEEGWTAEKWKAFGEWVLMSMFFAYLELDKEAMSQFSDEVFEQFCSLEEVA